MAFETRKEYFLKKVGERLRTVRLSQGYSLEAVAEGVDVAPGLLDKIENGLYDMDVTLLLSLCQFYDVMAYNLLEGL